MLQLQLLNDVAVIIMHIGISDRRFMQSRNHLTCVLVHNTGCTYNLSNTHIDLPVDDKLHDKQVTGKQLYKPYSQLQKRLS